MVPTQYALRAVGTHLRNGLRRCRQRHLCETETRAEWHVLGLAIYLRHSTALTARPLSRNLMVWPHITLD